MSDTDRLILLKMSVDAIRQQVNQQLDAITAEIEQMLPEQKPRRLVPDSMAGRKKYYKGFLSRPR